jgi:hypothetical protein
MDAAAHEEGKRVALLMAEFYLARVRPRQNEHSIKTTGFPLGAQIPEPKQDGHNGDSTLLHHGKPRSGSVCGVDVPVSGPIPELPLQGVLAADGTTISPGASNK